MKGITGIINPIPSTDKNPVAKINKNGLLESRNLYMNI
jgi:hypothetical protein